MGTIVIYYDVERKAFDEVANLCECKKDESNPFFTSVKVYYNGTNLRGDMRVEVSAGHTEIYKKMLQKVAEILSRY